MLFRKERNSLTVYVQPRVIMAVIAALAGVDGALSQAMHLVLR